MSSHVIEGGICTASRDPPANAHGELQTLLDDVRGDLLLGRLGDAQPADRMRAGADQSRPRPTSRSYVVLIDALPLRRACTSQLLHSFASEAELLSFSSLEEMMLQTLEFGLDRATTVVVVSMGGSSLAGPAAGDRLRCLATAAAQFPVVVVSDRDDLDDIVAAFRHGARGFIPTSIEPAVAVEALKLVRAGGTFYPVTALAHVAASRNAGSCAGATGATAPVVARLTPRQLAVLQFLQEGRSNKVIARELAMTESTVKVHVRQIMRKLSAANRTQAALRASEIMARGDETSG